MFELPHRRYTDMEEGGDIENNRLALRSISFTFRLYKSPEKDLYIRNVREIDLRSYLLFPFHLLFSKSVMMGYWYTDMFSSYLMTASKVNLEKFTLSLLKKLRRLFITENKRNLTSGQL